MKRPIKPTYKIYQTFDDYMSASGKWEEDIETYCDNLERKLRNYQKLVVHIYNANELFMKIANEQFSGREDD